MKKKQVKKITKKSTKKTKKSKQRVVSWKVYYKSKAFYKAEKSPLTFTQATNVRRTVDNMIKLGVIDEGSRDEVAIMLANLLMNSQEIRQNMRYIAASIARNENPKLRVRHAKDLLRRAMYA